LHDEVALDDRGRAAFVGASTAVFARTGETLAHLVGAGDVVLGRTVAGVDGPALGGGDCIAFRALFVGGGAAIAERCGGSVRAVAQVGQAAPGGAASEASATTSRSAAGAGSRSPPCSTTARRASS